MARIILLALVLLVAQTIIVAPDGSVTTIIAPVPPTTPMPGIPPGPLTR